MPNKILLQSPLLHGTSKARCYTAIFFTKFQTVYKSPNTIQATIYKIPILFWQLFTKAQCYFGNYLQKAQYYFGNFILASSIEKKRKKKIQNYWANNYSTKVQMLLGKRIILCSKPKTILWQKHILIYKIPKLMGSINC